MGTSPTTPPATDRAVALRLNGCSYRHIGAVLGCSQTWAHRLVQQAIQTPTTTPAERLRRAELVAIDTRLRALRTHRRALATVGGA